MPLSKIILKPGIDKQATATLNEGGWSDGNLIRFRDGQPQNWGGWTTQTTGISGTVRGIHTWTDLTGQTNCALGSNTHLYLWRGSQLSDITPAGFTAGPADAVLGFGYGMGTYGTGTYGTSHTIAILQQNPMTWSMDNWGQVLVCAPMSGPVYQWVPTGTTVNVATAISQAPGIVNRVMVGMPERHLICFGASDAGATTNFDPMLIRFSDVEDYTTWTATATNSAGSFRISGGSGIRSAIRTTNQIMVFTDTTAWSMRFVGSPYVYRFDQLGAECGIIGPNACTEYDGTVYWMSDDTFFRFRGNAPEDLDCTEQRAVFNNINRTQAHKIWCGLNSQHNEIVWFYPSASSTENDSYICYNYGENLWYSGSLVRTAWKDRDTFGDPLACNASGTLFAHETSVEADADGSPIPWFVESGYFDLADGAPYTFSDRAIPDMDMAGSVNFTLSTTNYPNQPPVAHGPYPLTASTQYQTFRARGRQAKIRFENAGVVGSRFRLGAFRLNIDANGAR